MRYSLLLGAVLLFGLTVSANADSIKDNNPEAPPGRPSSMNSEGFLTSISPFSAVS